MQFPVLLSGCACFIKRTEDIAWSPPMSLEHVDSLRLEGLLTKLPRKTPGAGNLFGSWVRFSNTK